MDWLISAIITIVLLLISIPFLPLYVGLVVLLLIIHVLVMFLVTYWGALRAMIRHKSTGSYIAVLPTELTKDGIQKWWQGYKDKLPPEMRGPTELLITDGMHVTVINSSWHVLSDYPMTSATESPCHYDIPAAFSIHKIPDYKLAIYKYRTGTACCLVLEFNSPQLNK